MMPGPGTGCAFVMCDQEEMRYTPDEYCNATVFPIVYCSSDILEQEGQNCTDVGKLPILENEEVVFCAQLPETVYQGRLKVLDDIYMCLIGS